MHKHAGFSLLEVLIVLLIVSLLLGMAAPSYQKHRDNAEQSAALNQLLGLLHYARSHAVERRTQVSLCPGDQQCSQQTPWQGQLLLFEDGNSNGLREPGERRLQSVTLDERTSWLWTSALRKPFLTFQADGASRGLNGTLTLCRHERPAKQLIIALGGRIRSQPSPAGARCR